jgi:hypothetical protein
MASLWLVHLFTLVDQFLIICIGNEWYLNIFNLLLYLVFKISNFNNIKKYFYQLQKEANGTDPSMAEFYCRTHRKKDQSWVGPCAESAYVSPISSTAASLICFSMTLSVILVHIISFLLIILLQFNSYLYFSVVFKCDAG